MSMNNQTRYAIKVIFDNYDTLITEINGTPETICDYYIGKTFNLGKGEHDKMAQALQVFFWDGETFLLHKRSLI